VTRRYRPCVGIMLLNRQSRVFVAQRSDMKSAAWQMPQGGIGSGEKPIDAAWREMKEEIGTDRARLLAESAGWYRYDLPEELARKLWGGRYCGQKQKWFAFRFEGGDRDIDIATERPEFTSWKWAPMQDLPDLIVPFKRQLYRDILAEFAYLAGDAASV